MSLKSSNFSPLSFFFFVPFWLDTQPIKRQLFVTGLWIARHAYQSHLRKSLLTRKSIEWRCKMLCKFLTLASTQLNADWIACRVWSKLHWEIYCWLTAFSTNQTVKLKNRILTSWLDLENDMMHGKAFFIPSLVFIRRPPQLSTPSYFIIYYECIHVKTGWAYGSHVRPQSKVLCDHGMPSGFFPCNQTSSDTF